MISQKRLEQIQVLAKAHETVVHDLLQDWLWLEKARRKLRAILDDCDGLTSPSLAKRLHEVLRETERPE